MLIQVEDRELVVLVLGILVAAFVIAHRKQLRAFPWWPLPVLAVGCLLIGWTISVAEDIWVLPWSNLAEHSLYALHSVLFATWAFRLSRQGIR